jgi:hypothetical protein
MARMESEDFIGTCQWCLGEYKVNPRRTMVLHGYTRPGNTGYTIGNCPGYDFAPFEYEHSKTDERIAQLKAHIASNERQVKMIDAGKITKVRNPYFIPANDSKRTDRWYRHDKSHDIEFLETGDRDFDRCLKSMKASIESSIRFDEGVLAYLVEAVNHWTKKGIVGLDSPATGKLRYLRGAYDPDKAKEAEEATARKKERDAKPGKITLTVYQALPDLPNSFANPGNPTPEEWAERLNAMEAEDDRQKQLRANLKNWVKENFPAEKYWAGDVYSGDITWRLRKDLQSKRVIAVAVKVDWKYRDNIEAMFPEGQFVARRDNSPKDLRWFIDLDEFPADL